MHQATVGVSNHLFIEARDAFGNLMQTGGHSPTLRAVGPTGVAFRASDVINFGNSTYRVTYLPTAPGLYRLYLTIGCCVPTSFDIGISTELVAIQPLLVTGNFFLLNVSATDALLSNTIAVGEGLLGGRAGTGRSISLYFRDLYGNAAPYSNYSKLQTQVSFFEAVSGERVSDRYYSVTEGRREPFDLTISYLLMRSGSFMMSISLSTEAGSTDQVVGSPFSIVVVPDIPAASFSKCRGRSLTDLLTAKNENQSFTVTLFDKYSNRVRTGGAKLYIRLEEGGGVVINGTGAVDLLPTCEDGNDGTHSCSYRPTVQGPHLLRVLLLSGQGQDRPGGDGLLAQYFDTAYPAQGIAPVLARVDGNIHFVWPSGRIYPFNDGTGVNLAVSISGETSTYGDRDRDRGSYRENGQSVSWTGYLVCPRSDLYRLSARIMNMNASIFLDSQLVFDSTLENGLMPSVQMEPGNAYRLLVVAHIIPSSYASSSQPTDVRPVEIALMWAARSFHISVVPGFFLYSSGEDLPGSPFRINVT